MRSGECEQPANSEDPISAERLLSQQIIRTIKNGIVVYDRELKYRIWNPFMEQLTGLSAQAVIGRPAVEVFPFLTQAGVIDGLRRALGGETVEVIDYPFDVPATGQQGWASNRITPLYDNSRTVIGVLESVQDITDRKEALRALKQSMARHEALTLNISDVIAIVDENGIITYVSPNVQKLFGLTADEIVGSSALSFVHEQDQNRLQRIFAKLLEAEGQMLTVEFRHRCGDKTWRDVELTGINRCGDPDINGILINYHDISLRKKKEREVIWLSYHDALTGLYNRAFFEEEIRRIDVPRQYPISFIIADINGLKYANDTFGHSFGDAYLTGFAGVLRSCLRKEDVIARWGGDEFVVLLPQTSSAAAQALCERIRQNACQTRIGHQSISVALGFASKTSEKQAFAAIIKEAEDLMYQNKLLENKSRRSETVASLMKAMYEQGYETAEHEQQLLEIVTQIGARLGLMPQEIKELRLLAVLHDIGKLGIAKELLVKTEPLTAAELNEIRRHSEIGYRIAAATPGLEPIAKYILSVHEAWDGSGYPQGIKGNAIPKLSRIVAIIDAYDAMISGRPYRAPLSHEEAIREIASRSGRQFDPSLVELFCSPGVSGYRCESQAKRPNCEQPPVLTSHGSGQAV